jgi:hypothetical protein
MNPTITPIPIPKASPNPLLPRSGFATVSLVFGIISVLICLIPVAGLVCPIIAIILGIVGLKRTRVGLARGNGFAITGIILGCVGLVGTIFLSVPVLFYFILKNCTSAAC